MTLFHLCRERLPTPDALHVYFYEYNDSYCQSSSVVVLSDTRTGGKTGNVLAPLAPESYSSAFKCFNVLLITQFHTTKQLADALMRHHPNLLQNASLRQTPTLSFSSHAYRQSIDEIDAFMCRSIRPLGPLPNRIEFNLIGILEIPRQISHIFL